MIVTLEQVKRAVEIPLTDADNDTALTEMVAQATAWIEGETKRRFDTPAPRIELIRGAGRPTLYLGGHIDVDPPTANDITVRERTFYYESDWETLDPTTYERRGDVLYRRADVWNIGFEYECTYNDGYTTAPADIQALALELIIGQYAADPLGASTQGGLTSETLVGVYSYTISADAVVTSGAVGGGTFSTTGARTINRWKRLLI